MSYSILQAAKRTGLSTYTLRYYEKEGLLPNVERTAGGIRAYKESDFEWLSIITCLKQSGMPVKQIKEFIDLCQEGDATLKERLDIFLEHKKAVEIKMAELQKHMMKINHKIQYYTTAIEAGTEAIHKGNPCPDVDELEV